MREKINKIVIAKDGWPLEQIIGHPITNFFRRLFLASHKECRDCWEHKQARKNPNISNPLTPISSMKKYKLHYKGNDIAENDSITVLVEADNEEEAKKKGYLEIWLDFIEESENP